MLHIGFLDYLREMNFAALVLRFVLGAVCGGAIGLEREKKQRPAGFRTHILVCVGSVTAMVVGLYLHDAGYPTDVARLGAQVISGIGFLGAGTILVTRQHHIKGLTTAAGLWASACIGLAVGAGFYEAALFGTALIIIVSSYLFRVSKNVFENSKYIRLYVELREASCIGVLLKELERLGISMSDSDVERSAERQIVVLMCELECQSATDHRELLAELRRVDGVITIEEI